MTIGYFGGEIWLETLARNTIDSYYEMNEEQRTFILKVIELNPTWKKYDFMKALALFNKAKELGVDMSDEKLDSFVKSLDENSSNLNFWLRKVDTELWKKLGLI
jgi:hypothetical protein